MAGEGGVGRLEVRGGGGEQSGHGRDHSAWHLHYCIRRHSFGIVVSRGGYDLVRTGGQAGVLAGSRGHRPSPRACWAGRPAGGWPGARLGGREESGVGGVCSVSEESLGVPPRHPGIVGEREDGGEAGEVLVARTAQGHGVGGEPTQLTRSG